MPRFPRPMSFDQPSTSGPLERVAPRFESTITASTWPLPDNVSAKCRAPASPSWPPSTDASTSVFFDARPSNTRANSISAAVSAALPASSGIVAASRAAITTICLFVLPGRRPITFTSFVPSWSKRSMVVEKPWLRKACFTREATAASSGRPARRSGVVVAMSRTRLAVPTPSNNASAARPCGAARGGDSSENATSTSAKSAGRKAARYMRGSITFRASPRSNLQFRGLGLLMASQAPRILLVDDEHAVQKLLAFPLRKDGYDVVAATTGDEALDRFREGEFDLVVLDVMLPQVDGFEVCRQLRARSSVPIIMLTAKAEEFDKVLGLELGADDYITKPFSMREFRSRVKAVLRRADLRSNGDQAEQPLEDREVRIDFGKRQVEVRGEPVKLTYVEFEILAILARSPGRVFSRTMLLERLWGDAAYRDPRTIDVHIRHLREKIERDAKEPELIFTVRGVGYHFRDR